jgi:hypothetical protein
MDKVFPMSEPSVSHESATVRSMIADPAYAEKYLLDVSCDGTPQEMRIALFRAAQVIAALAQRSAPSAEFAALVEFGTNQYRESLGLSVPAPEGRFNEDVTYCRRSVYPFADHPKRHGLRPCDCAGPCPVEGQVGGTLPADSPSAAGERFGSPSVSGVPEIAGASDDPLLMACGELSRALGDPCLPHRRGEHPAISVMREAAARLAVQQGEGR